MTMRNVYESGEAPRQMPKFMHDPAIKAMPLGVFNGEKVRPKPGKENLCFRWVNRVSHEGERLQKSEWAGFRFAGPDDCEVEGKKANAEGRFINQDTILMCIERSLYEGALKHNAVTNLMQMGDGQAAKQFQSTIDAQPGAREDKAKISTFKVGGTDFKDTKS